MLGNLVNLMVLDLVEFVLLGGFDNYQMSKKEE
jgi:hypothetical protein